MDNTVNKIRQKIFGKATLIFLGIMLFLTFFSNTINNFSLPVVHYEIPTGGPIVKEVTGNGAVSAKRFQNIYTDISQLVLEVKVKTGERVKKGQTLLILDQTELNDRLRQAQIKYEQLELNLSKISKIQELETNVENTQRLYEIGGASRQALEQAQKELKTLQIDIQNARNDLKLQEIELNKLQKSVVAGRILSAPFDGIVAAIACKASEKTNPVQPVITIVDIAQGFIFTATVSNENAGYLALGDQVSITMDALNGRTLHGVIDEIRDNPEQRGLKKDILISLPANDLSGGESGAFTVRKPIKNYDLIISNAAIGADNNGQFVYVIKEKKGPLGNEYYVQQAYIVAGESDNLKTGVINGIFFGEKVVIGSDKPISDGSRVAVQD